MGCGCKNKKQEKPTQPPVSIRLTEVQQTPPPQSIQTPQATSTNNQ